MTEAPGRYSTTLCFKLSGAVVPKARPRVTKRGTFMHRYRDWKALAVGALSDQAKAHVLDTPITSATVQIELMGKHPRRGDLDNIAGSILDVLVQAGILRDDSISVVSSLSIALQYSTQSPIVQIQLGNLG